VKVDTGYLVGCDLGQASDYTAVAVLQRWEHRQYRDARGDLVSTAYVEEMRRDRVHRRFQAEVRRAYDIVHLERLPIGTPYPKVVAALRDLLGRPELQSDEGERLPPVLVVDATGVGRPVVDALRADKLAPIAVTITGADVVSFGGTTWRVPKRDLVGVLSVLLQNEALQIAAQLSYAHALVDELLRFKVKVNPVSLHDSYGAWRDGEHDDLVLAAAIAAWWGERRQRPVRAEDYMIARIHA
jgi:hypothetical protein